MTAQHHPVHTSPNIVQFFSFPFFVFFFYYLRFFFLVMSPFLHLLTLLLM